MNISDEALSFFELLHNSVCHLQGPHALTKHGAGVLNVVKSHTLLDTNIQQQYNLQSVLIQMMILISLTYFTTTVSFAI